MRGIPGRVGVGDEEHVLVRRRAEAPGFSCENKWLSKWRREKEGEGKKKKEFIE